MASTLPLAHSVTTINAFSPSLAPTSSSYVLSLAADSSERVLGVAGSEFDVKLYDRQTLACVREAGRHSGRINELAFANAASSTTSDVLYSAASDGTVCAWDPKAEGCAATLEIGQEEVWSVDVSAGHLLAVGTQTAVLVWDLRRAQRPLSRFEVHTEDVTQVRFQPGSATTLLSASVDGLLCSLDCTATDEDAAVTGVHNVGEPVTGLGFFGDAPAAHVYCLTSLEHLSIWQLQPAQQLAFFDHLRRPPDMDEPPAADEDAIDYLIGCEWDPASQRLLLLAGDYSGTVHIFAVESTTVVALQSLRASLGGGHSAGGGHADTVRCFHWGCSSLVTAGEDARICMWRPSTLGETAGSASTCGSAAGAGARKAAMSHEANRRRHTPY
mmetsp:Transcript_31902/g.74347  ORF Transcript_31902/g.74347 Transcript_31902/m.74347 type:complete len:385 (-) Transcript_31902:247-1401(-)